MNIAVLWDVMMRGLVGRYQQCEGIYTDHDAGHEFKKSVYFLLKNGMKRHVKGNIASIAIWFRN
jgi:hypothetical protein